MFASRRFRRGTATKLDVAQATSTLQQTTPHLPNSHFFVDFGRRRDHTGGRCPCCGGGVWLGGALPSMEDYYVHEPFRLPCTGCLNRALGNECPCRGTEE